MKVLPLVLFFMAAPLCAAAPPFVCDSIRRGDTAARLALRLTNNAANRDAPWFQILDPATSRFVSKATYDVIRPGWRVCIAREGISGPAPPRNNVAPPRVGLPTAPLWEWRTVLLTYWRWASAVFVVGLVLALPAAKRYFYAQRAKRAAMMRFAATFVREFARPLPRRHPADRPVMVRLRCAPHRGRVDILLAPNCGHTYPNVFDHKKNLDYDIQRVLRVVPHQLFVPGEPYARGDWVVIPFRVERV